ncbi:hypothetical protein LR48_Vigan10g269200 [Vigna angularis]|uniref:Uncharacterized protein n=1 Tax=Phaseolus angularis TaxID=3914 RepID=A0A0L9VP25_PHAAN|nr:hypothetical protein LR48_Vigan10g269200 [Vigna angularis]
METGLVTNILDRLPSIPHNTHRTHKNRHQLKSHPPKNTSSGTHQIRTIKIKETKL